MPKRISGREFLHFLFCSGNITAEPVTAIIILTAIGEKLNMLQSFGAGCNSLPTVMADVNQHKSVTRMQLNKHMRLSR